MPIMRARVFTPVSLYVCICVCSSS